ncbi:MAG: helix-turn-helix domain-containing protein [Candidatus Acidiferrum sp.]
METIKPSEAAQRLRVSLNRIYFLIAAGRLPGTQQVRGHWRIPVAAIDELLMERSLVEQVQLLRAQVCLLRHRAECGLSVTVDSLRRTENLARKVEVGCASRSAADVREGL